MRPNAFTLIEATAALAICSTVVVLLLGVRSRLITQSAKTANVARANVVAGRLLGEWKSGIISIRPNERASGLDEATGMRWQAACQYEEYARDVLLMCLRMQVYESLPNSQPLVTLEAWESPGD